jgi:hypothetical protein
MQIQELAHRHGFSTAAIQQLWDGLIKSDGRAVQFNHPEFGGMGQWMPGLVMIGDMFNDGLKDRLNRLCYELAGYIQASDEPTLPTNKIQVWWPPELGKPSLQGDQNDLSYAFFPRFHRLALRSEGRVILYDTSEYTVSGISQQEMKGIMVLFIHTPQGLIPLNQLEEA